MTMSQVELSKIDCQKSMVALMVLLTAVAVDGSGHRLILCYTVFAVVLVLDVNVNVTGYRVVVGK